MLRVSKGASGSPDEGLAALLVDRVRERVLLPGSAIELAMRILICCEPGIACIPDIVALLELQEADGGWPISRAYSYSPTGLQIGPRGLTTAMAIKAISSV